MAISDTQLKVLRKAATREHGNVCPITANVHAAAEQSVLDALERRGLIHYPTSGVPIITDAGREAARLESRDCDGVLLRVGDEVHRVEFMKSEKPLRYLVTAIGCGVHIDGHINVQGGGLIWERSTRFKKAGA